MTKSERTRLRVGTAIATFSTVLVGILIVAVLHSQFHRSLMESRASLARKSVATALEEFQEILEQESKRPFTEYGHSNFSGVSAKSFLNFSNISSVDPSVRIPGLVGFFQIAEKKKLELPFFPEGLSTDQQDRDKRKALARKIFGSVYKTRPINSNSITQDRFRQIFNGIWLPTFDATDVITPKFVPTKKLSPKMLKAVSPIEKVEDLNPQSKSLSSNSQALPIQSFVLESGYLVFFRNVLHRNRLLTQGFIVEQKTFFSSLFRDLLDDPKRKNENAARLTVLIEDRALGFFPSPASDDIPLFQTNELLPFEGLSLFVSSPKPRLPIIQIAALASVVLIVLIIIGAILLLYRTAIRQLELSERQAAFVSSVSHELRTPITAIRMHGELLKAGWADTQASKESSYDYILKESERLSRLIENVLRYARIGRDSDPLSSEKISYNDLKLLLTEKISPIVAQSGLVLEVNDHIRPDNPIEIEVDRDALTQILINIVDNSIKFSRLSDPKKIVISLKSVEKFVEVGIRDFGPGISAENGSKVFDLFYRSEDELTRTTPGTGLGLALVKSLSDRMAISVKFENREPGCEFILKIENYLVG